MRIRGRMRRPGIVAMLVGIVAGLATPLCAQSRTASASMRVSIEVVARAIVTVERQPMITVTSQDLVRGYVDATEPILVRVRTNSRQGYLLHAENLNDHFLSIELSSADVVMSVGRRESWIHRPYVKGGDELTMRAHVLLSAGATTGSFPLPIVFEASPL
ncbi:MAG: hypothetical protein NVSMB68_06570 [Thermoanaerobaculia bacterium]